MQKLSGLLTLTGLSSTIAARTSGDVIASGRIFAEIGEVVLGKKPGRQSADEITLYKSVGVAVQDVVSADLVYRKAKEAGLK